MRAATTAPGAGLDARLEFTFPREGNYYVEVTDARFSTQAQNFYRLKMGSYRYAEGIFPLGGRRGEQTAVTFFGALGAGDRPRSTCARPGRRTPSRGSRCPTPLPCPSCSRSAICPEVREPVEGAVAIPATINGRLDKDREVDHYRLKVEPGDKLLLEMQARELGTSKLEAIVTAYDTGGQEARVGGRPAAARGRLRGPGHQPDQQRSVPESDRARRTSTRSTVTVEDLALRGGPLYGYRLIARKQAEDFKLTIGSPQLNIPAGGTVASASTADRRGFDGPIQLTIPDLPKGIRVEGGVIPARVSSTPATRAP